ncbi:hypothetical protein JCM8547_001742 [Rhodosporidiobolus lusitaniae]
MLLYSHSALRASHRSTCFPFPRTRPSAPPHRLFSSTPPSYRSPALSTDVDHYAVLGLSRTATRKEIKERFYDLSRKHHPDAPSTSSETPDQRLAKFQQLSNSYSILSDPDQRRSYDLQRGGSAQPAHRRRPGHHHPGYTSASGGMGYSGGRGGGGMGMGGSENEDRRERANYAWQHPKRGQSAGEQAAGAAHARHDPFASRRSAYGPSQTADHFSAYAKRASMRNEQQWAAQTSKTGGKKTDDHHYRAGTSVFGAAKAEEESRLINDSSTLRSGQVFLMFASVFVIAVLFGRKSHGDEHQQGSKRR